ncbi:uncharacterized protein LOC131145850 [Malania oleifera]|uniref:uncharacterized protein LOC131145850 n=1 Tax=Malania oleifera TaxID=397392 RepID=UPI0025AE9486|nr:uncharacterized protein LOC131145850 [Malania oleifera]
MAKGSRERSCTIEQFMRMNPQYFSRGKDPFITEDWIQEIEETLSVLSCKDEQKVLFVALKLIREAKHWWRSVRLLKEQRPSLYAARFNKLSRFAPYLVPDKEKNTRKFESGLGQGLYEQVVGYQVQTFLELVDKATVIKRSLYRGARAQNQRKGPMPPDF